MQRISICVIALLASAGAPAAFAAEAGEGKPAIRVFDIEARVTVDPSGAVTRIQPPPPLPRALAEVLDVEVHRLHFLPPKVDGRPVTVETNVRVQACGLRGSDYSTYTMRYRAHGPSLAFPRMPQMSDRAKESTGVNEGFAIYDLGVDVSADGKATMASIQMRPESTLRQTDYLLRRPVKHWVEDAHFMPELVDGRARPAHLDTAIEFHVSEALTTTGLQRWREEELQSQERARTPAATCEVAHALDTPQSAALPPSAEFLDSVLELQPQEDTEPAPSAGLDTAMRG